MHHHHHHHHHRSPLQHSSTPFSYSPTWAEPGMEVKPTRTAILVAMNKTIMRRSIWVAVATKSNAKPTDRVVLTDHTKGYVRFLLFLRFWGFNHHYEPCHRHDGIFFYYILSTKIRPPRMTGKLPASGHWRFCGTMTPSRSEQAALAAGDNACA